MTIHATMNPVGSTNPKDLIDNAQNLDWLILGPLLSYPDRLGVNRLSWAGIEASFAAAQTARATEYAADKLARDTEFEEDQAERIAEFDAAQDNREVQFNTFMDASGYEPPIPYTSGILLDRTTKTVSYLGNEYRAKGSFIPMTTSNWATDEAKLKLVGDDSLRQNLASPALGAKLVYGATRHVGSMDVLRAVPGRYTGDTMDLASFHSGWALEVWHPFPSGGGKFIWDSSLTSADDGGVIISVAGVAQGRWVRPVDGPVNVTWWGAKGDGVTIDRLPIQHAINFGSARRLPVYVPGRVKEYMIDFSLWAPTKTKLIGDAGRGKFTKIKRVNGHYTDLIVSGVHTEGVDNTVAPRVLKYRNGMPYTEDNIGSDIEISGIYLDGNGLNAGVAPEFGPGVTSVSYRGSNILFRFVDGVKIDDVFSEFASNDCCQVVRCRRVSVTASTFSRNKLVNPVIGDTRNGLTIGGTLNGLGFQDADYLIVHDIISEEPEDLGVAVQFLDTAAHPATFSGTMSITKIRTRLCASYGTALEVYGDDNRQVKRKNFVIDDIISEDDNTQGLALSSLLLSQKTMNVTMSNYIVRNAGSRALTIAGGRNVTLTAGIIDGFNTRGLPSIAALLAYAEAGETPELLNIQGLDISGGEGRGGDTYGAAISGFRKVKGSGVTVKGTTYLSVADGAGVLVNAPYIDFSHSHVEECGANGFRFTGYKDLSAVALTTLNVGKGGLAANQIGINAGAGSNRTGRITACHTMDDQAIHTMSIGILLGVSATDAIMVTGNQCSGARNDALVNLGMPNAYVHGNGFQYVGQTLPLNVGGVGNYLSGFRFGGGYRLWVEQATGKWRTKFGAPSSDADGTVVGTQAA